MPRPTRPCGVSARAGRCACGAGADRRLLAAGSAAPRPAHPGTAGGRPAAGAAQAHPLGLPPAVVNADWTHRNGASGGRIVHPALRPMPELVWAVDIGQGAGKRSRVLVGPIVAGGLIYAHRRRRPALGAHPQRAARLAHEPGAGGPGARFSGPGGGMSEAGGVLFVGTGFGEVMALDPRTGGAFWRRTAGGPDRARRRRCGTAGCCSSPATTSRYGLDARSGETLWRVQGTGGVGLLGSASPAVEGRLAVLPFASGEVLGVLARNGLSVWGAAVTGGRPGLARERHHRHQRRPGDRRRRGLRLEPGRPHRAARPPDRRAALDDPGGLLRPGLAGGRLGLPASPTRARWSAPMPRPARCSGR